MYHSRLKLFASTIAFCVSIVSPSVFAEPGGHHKVGKNGHYQGKKSNKGNKSSKGEGTRSYAARSFDDRQRLIIHDYFAPRFRSGRCPPGLAKKYNRCIPPGQAKKWRVGYPLPPGLIFHPLPAQLTARLGAPGPGYRYVRVAADVLLIAAGTGLVVDAIQDLNSM